MAELADHMELEGDMLYESSEGLDSEVEMAKRGGKGRSRRWQFGAVVCHYKPNIYYLTCGYFNFMTCSYANS